MRKAERLFQVVNLIRVHQPITAARLAEALGISVRSVYRYIDDLSQSGIPIYGEAGVGYAMHENFELPPLTLTGGELEALTVAVDMLSKSAGYEFSQTARSLLAKINAALPSSFERPTEQRVRSFASAGALPGMGCWDELHKAIRDRRFVLVSYKTIAGIPSAREILPLGLFYWGGKWTVGSWCSLRQAYRDFRVDRIERLAPGTPSASPPEHVSLAAYLAHQAAAWQEATDNTLSVAD